MTWEDFFDSITDQERRIVRMYSYMLSRPEMWRILEIGSGWGIFSRTCMHFDRELTTIDKSKKLDAFDLNMQGYEGKYKRIVGDSKKILPQMRDQENLKFDLIFVDGDHTYQGALSDMNDSWPMVRRGGVMMVDDVFHKNNWDKLSDGSFNFGVAQALWDFIVDKKDTTFFKVYNAGHGIAAIFKL